MSRGPGKLQLAVMERLGVSAKTLDQLATLVFGVSASTLRPARKSSLRRALRGLARRGLVRPTTDPSDPYRRRRWRLAPSEPERQAEQAQVRRGARRRQAQERVLREHIRSIAATARAEAEERAARCSWCGLPRTPEGHDGCLGHLPGAAAACCGHGGDFGYVMFEGGLTIRGWFDHVAHRLGGSPRGAPRRAIEGYLTPLPIGGAPRAADVQVADPESAPQPAPGAPGVGAGALPPRVEPVG